VNDVLKRYFDEFELFGKKKVLENNMWNADYATKTPLEKLTTEPF
jgi:hypothetical protein